MPMTNYLPRFEYRGHDRRGVAHTGRTLIDVAKFVRDRYEKGWRDLTVTSLSHGDQAGGINIDPTSGRRIWWSE